MTIKRLILYIFIILCVLSAFNGLLMAMEVIPFIVSYIPSVVCFIGGIIAVIIGGKLYLKGIGQHQDGTEIVEGKLKISLKTVGSVLMATSLGWSYIGYLTIPNIDKILEINIESSFIENPSSFGGTSLYVNQKGMLGKNSISEEEGTILGAKVNSRNSSQITLFGGQVSRYISKAPPKKIDMDNIESISIFFDKEDTDKINIVYTDKLINQWGPEDGVVYSVLQKVISKNISKLEAKE